MPAFNKQFLEVEAKKYDFNRDTFEKVVRHRRILEYINGDNYLCNHLWLKGGTAINLTIFDLPRLSVDIDFDYSPNDEKSDMEEARERIKTMLLDYMESEDYVLASNSRFMQSLDGFHFQYINSAGNRDAIKIEINYSLRAHIFESMMVNTIPRIFDENIIIRTVAPIEIFAAKANALMNRAASRDLYDFSNMIDVNMFDDKRDLFPVIEIKPNFDLEGMKNKTKEFIKELMVLSESEVDYLEHFEAKDYRPEMLFEESEIIERIKKHPMALWKCR